MQIDIRSPTQPGVSFAGQKGLDGLEASVTLYVKDNTASILAWIATLGTIAENTGHLPELVPVQTGGEE